MTQCSCFKKTVVNHPSSEITGTQQVRYQPYELRWCSHPRGPVNEADVLARWTDTHQLTCRGDLEHCQIPADQR